MVRVLTIAARRRGRASLLYRRLTVPRRRARTRRQCLLVHFMLHLVTRTRRSAVRYCDAAVAATAIRLFFHAGVN